MSSTQLISVGRVAGSAFETLESRLCLSASLPLSAFPPGPQQFWSAATGMVSVDLAAPEATDAGLGGTTPDARAARSPLGGNLNMQSDRIQDHPFTDLVKTTRGFYNLAGRLASNGKMALANTDGSGWATEDFALSLADNAEYKVPIEVGTYRMSFTGPSGTAVAARRSAPAGAATVSSDATLPTLTKIGYNAASGLHTYDIAVPGGVLTLALDFRNTGGGVRDLKVLQPGYSLGAYPTFSNEYVNLLKNLSPNVVRMMDFTQTNNNPVSSWDTRTKPTDATQTKVKTAGDLVPAKGIAWEYAIQLANTLGTGVWVNVPAQASNDYVSRLATLLRTTLGSDLTVYLEYSNEVWNTQFGQTKYNTDQAKAEVAANPGSNLKYDGSTNPVTWADRRYARRLKEITDLFKNNWTAAGQPNPLNGRVRAVLAGQSANQARFDNELNYLNRFYGAPKNYLYGIGVAPYINLGGKQNVDGLTKDQVLDALQSSVNGYRNGTGLASAKGRADRWGLKLTAYEGGIDSFGSKSIAAKRSAMLDPRIKNIVTDYLGVWYAKGGQQFNWYTLGARSFNSPNGTWSITEDIGDYGQPKMVAYREVRDAGLGNATEPAPTPLPPPPPGAVTLRAGADAYVRDGTHAGANFGTATALQVKQGSAGYTRESYLRFDLSQVSNIGSAKLRLFGKLDNTLAASAGFGVYGSPNATWSESGVTWNSKLASGTTVQAAGTVAGTTGRRYEVDLTNFLKAEQAAGHDVVTLVLRANAASQSTIVFDSDEAANRPELVVS